MSVEDKMAAPPLKVKHWLESYKWERYSPSHSSQYYWRHEEHGRGFQWYEAVAIQTVVNGSVNQGHQSHDPGD